ncbi:M23 family metallopeptidase [Kitasatospora sp. NPDC049258]|uniref:murein hydrolase activator EnvC family protein n=1 Tax=Kitasatospora sp. NPDC049258 TaxID=3155394 RepID=UPI003438D27E
MTAMRLRPVPTLLAGVRSATPPPAPDRGRRAALLALLLAVVVALSWPPASARARSDSSRSDSQGRAAPPGPAQVLGVAAPPGPGSGRAWPVGGPGALARRFEAPAARWAAGHRGVDLVASAGAPVRAAAPGVVVFSGPVAGRPVVTVQHPGSGSPPLRTTYLPVAGTAPVGTSVSAGEVIGTLADGGGHCAAGCLHWGLLRGDRYLDPLALFGAGRARLLPLSGGSAVRGRD